MATAQLKHNPFSKAEIEQARQIGLVAAEMLSFLDRCSRCKLAVAHLVDTVTQIRDIMVAISEEFGSDATD